MSSDIAIKVEGLSKCYQIYEQPRDRLKQFFLPRIRRAAGLQLKNFYREFWALKDVSFEVKRGETVGIIGRNGSGKSTFLQIVCGTLSSSSGSVHTSGRIAALLELGSGFNPEFSGRENVRLNAALYGLSSDEIDARFDQILEFSEIGDFIDQPVKHYSSGMFVRLAFAVIAHVDADILIIDEALAVGDIRFQNKCRRKLEEFRKAGCAILFVSHSPSEIEAFCDRAIWLHQGAIKATGKPSRLVREYINYMVHGVEYSGDSSQEKSMSDPSSPKRLHAWEWIPLGAQNNIKYVSRARFEAIRVKFDGASAATFIDSKSTNLEVEAKIAVHEPILRPLLAIGVFNNLNEPIVHTNSFNLGETTQALDGSHAVVMKAEFVLPPLRPGDYLIAVGIDDGEPGASEILCHVYGAWAFRVQLPISRRPQGGYVQLSDAKLEIKPMETSQ